MRYKDYDYHFLDTFLKELFNECKHGDQDHQDWLENKFTDYLNKKFKKNMSTFLDRLVNEQKDLETKINGLCIFIDSDGFNKLSLANRELLHLQFSHMNDYNRILKIRLELIQS